MTVNNKSISAVEKSVCIIGINATIDRGFFVRNHGLVDKGS